MVRCRPLTDHHALSATATTARLRLRGRLTRAERERDLYAYLPFDVPAGIAAIRISLDHDPPGDAKDRTRGAVLDLGLMGPGHLDFGTPAFRGWSGSERRTVLVGARQATPGYRTGPIEAGRWHIVLGLCGIPVTGCDYQAEVELLELEPTNEPGATPGTPVASPAMPTVVAPSGQRWIACDLHAHTVHSDGADEIATVCSAMDAIHAQRGLASVNHPASDGSPWTHGVNLPFDLVEVWNGPWRPENAAALDWWAGLLRSGRRRSAAATCTR